MKPRRTPCSFSNFSRYFLRNSMTGAMLTSLKVVRMAAMDCDCTRRSAMRARRRDIGTRCSGRSASTASMLTAVGWVNAGFTATAAGATCVTGLAGATAAPAPSASPLVIRPPRPVPSMEAGSIPFSSMILRAAGMAFAAAGAAASTAGLATEAAASTVAAALASVSICAIVSPLTTVAPSPLMILTMTPATGAGNSSTTLSVSMSIRFSSRATASPAFLCQLTSVASATDSESCGTLTSISIMYDSLIPVL